MRVTKSNAGSRAKAIGIITQYYPRSWKAISETLAEHLAAQGHQVKVLTTPFGDDLPLVVSPEANPQVKLVPSYRDSSKSGLRRILSYLSFSFASLREIGYLKNVDVNYVYATQPTAAIVADAVKHFWGVPFVMHIQDVWPDSVTHSGMTGGPKLTSLLDFFLQPWVRYIYGRADALVAISPSMRTLLLDRGFCESRVHAIYNWSFGSVLVGGENSTVAERREKTVFLYGGNLGPLQDLENLLEAFSKMSQRDDVELVMAGEGSMARHLRSSAKSAGLENVRFTGWLTSDAMAREVSRADFLLVTLKDLEIFEGTVPSKFQAALSAGKPVVTAVNGEVGRIVKSGGLGFSARAEDPKALTRALERAAEMGETERSLMGRRARRFYIDNMSKQRGVMSMECVLISVAEAARAERRRV